ncbi:beclin 1-associated autophagy-related key regulator isoform X2 [Lingula anatina]|uniref:Beclin 1-associated autophagy-related key regulator isoform X2 n=1 Tax=Lingula anatina TaxID=7574 RepID=A0A1S3HPK1_LINAN|nr:beclin 1-associated autophagy-related key regulator isoform X2 [Lingula anatina]|eukprot:XP_013387967.1 beclin 1-associated autophagy-related key regulator isoform X2 [Lingula anatina]
MSITSMKLNVSYSYEHYELLKNPKHLFYFPKTKLTSRKQMAASSSTGSSIAPNIFQLSSSFEDTEGGISVAVERCPLCRNSRRPFTCQRCLRDGNFAHSKCENPDNRDKFSVKLRKWHALKKERSKVLARVESAVQKHLDIDAKKTEIQLYTKKLNLLQKAIEEVKSKEARDQDNLKAIKKNNAYKNSKVKKQQEKLKRILKYMEDGQNKMETREGFLIESEDELSKIRRQRIDELGTFIFSIKEIEPKSEVDSMQLSTVSALAEARRTAYVRGKWIYTDNGGELQYQVVDPKLPGHGDYSAYCAWISQADKKHSAEGELGHLNPAYTLCAALGYTTQITQVLAFILDVNLPKRLCYSEFFGCDLTEKQFNSAVNRLNHQVLHLCFTQNVSPEKLHPRQTIHNMLLLLKSAHLGRSGMFQVSPDLMQSIEEECSQSDSEEEEEDNSNILPGFTLQDIPEDWEAVPTCIPEIPVPFRDSDTKMTQAQSRTREAGTASTLTTSAVTGSLMSAAASLSSFWPWRTADTSRYESKDGK